ncbi:MAG: glycosyltransferase [Porticoccus sp.]|nr:glycosyltransferase [Porticoccus sp.]
MKFSIVTISYNQGRYLKQCIESVLSQKNVDIEYIIVDPGSSDNSREIINSYKEIKKIYKKDKGPADGLNNGFKIATGDFFGFINSDDYLLPNSISKLQNEILKSNASFISGKGLEILNGKSNIISPTKLTLDKMLYQSSIIFQPSTFFSKILYNKINGFNKENRTCWDYELFTDFLTVGAEHHLFEEPIAAFRVYPESITGSGRLKKQIKIDMNRVFKKYKNRDYNYFDKSINIYQRILNKLS